MVGAENNCSGFFRAAIEVFGFGCQTTALATAEVSVDGLGTWRSASSSNESCNVGHAFLWGAGLEYEGTYYVAEFLRIQLRSTEGVQGCWASVLVRGVTELR